MTEPTQQTLDEMRQAVAELDALRAENDALATRVRTLEAREWAAGLLMANGEGLLSKLNAERDALRAQRDKLLAALATISTQVDDAFDTWPDCQAALYAISESVDAANGEQETPDA